MQVGDRSDDDRVTSHRRRDRGSEPGHRQTEEAEAISRSGRHVRRRLRGASDPALVSRRTARIQGLVHLLTLVGASVVLWRVNRDQWFIADEWDFLLFRGVRGAQIGPFVPHNEHWTTVPLLIYRLLFNLFGMRSYMPYVVALVLAHLLVVHLLWRLMRRMNVDSSVLGMLILIYALLGAGYENLLFAFQICFVGSLAFGLLHVLLVADEGPFGRRDVLGWLAASTGLMFSGIGVPLVTVAGLVALFRRGVKVALLTVLVPAGVYVTWFALVGKAGYGSDDTDPASLLRVPGYVWTGLSTSIQRALGLPGSGGVFLLLLAVWLLLRGRLRRTKASPAVAMAIGAAIMFGITAIGRSAGGSEQAGSSRYAYLSLALLLPAVALLLTEVVRRFPPSRLVVLVLSALLFVHNVDQLHRNAAEEAEREQVIKRKLFAAIEIGDSGSQLLSTVPEPYFDPGVNVFALQRLSRQGKLPGGVLVGASDRFAAATLLQLAVTDVPLVAGAPDPPGGRPVIVATARLTAALSGGSCHRLVSTGPDAQLVIDPQGPRSLLLRSSVPGQLGVALSDGGVGAPVGPSVAFPVPANVNRWVNVSRPSAWLFLTLPRGEVELCNGAGA